MWSLCENPFAMSNSPNDLREIFAKNLRRIYEERDYTEKELSDLTGLDSSYCGRLIRGDRVPTLDTIQKICDGLDVEVTDLLVEQEDDLN